jgi:hypothetical protein
MDFFLSMEDEFVFRNARVTYGGTFRNLSNSRGLQERYGLEDYHYHSKGPDEGILPRLIESSVAYQTISI